MHIYYQGIPGSYSSMVADAIQGSILSQTYETHGSSHFGYIWQKIQEGHIGVLPVENSYAGSIHENIYNFLRFDAHVIGVYDLGVSHCLAATHQDLSKITTAFSHPQALAQCYSFLTNHDIKQQKYADTAGAAQFVSEQKNISYAAICSTKAASLYNLTIIQENIQDQQNNTTKFFVVVKDPTSREYTKKSGHMSCVFRTKDVPAVLYKCLGAFATNNINLTKIESMPSLDDPFVSAFFLSFLGSHQDKNIQQALDELSYFAYDIKILGEY